MKEMDTEVSSKQPKRRSKPKVTAVWKMEDIRKLIEAVEQQPSIWDFGHQDHKNLSKREAAWRDIVEEFQNRYSNTECKAKWINIKNAYSNVKSKIKSTKSGQGTETPPSWTYWNDMRFLIEKESVTNTVSVSTLDSIHIECNELEEVLEMSQKNQPLNSPPAASGSGIPSRKRKVSCAPVTSTADLIEKANKTLESLSADDEFQVMGAYLASHVRNIARTNRVAADRLHRKLIKTVLDCLDDMDNSTALINTTTTANVDA